MAKSEHAQGGQKPPIVPAALTAAGGFPPIPAKALATLGDRVYRQEVTIPGVGKIRADTKIIEKRKVTGRPFERKPKAAAAAPPARPATEAPPVVAPAPVAPHSSGVHSNIGLALIVIGIVIVLVGFSCGNYLIEIRDSMGGYTHSFFASSAKGNAVIVDQLKQVNAELAKQSQGSAALEAKLDSVVDGLKANTDAVGKLADSVAARKPWPQAPSLQFPPRPEPQVIYVPSAVNPNTEAVTPQPQAAASPPTEYDSIVLGHIQAYRVVKVGAEPRWKHFHQEPVAPGGISESYSYGQLDADRIQLTFAEGVVIHVKIKHMEGETLVPLPRNGFFWVPKETESIKFENTTSQPLVVMLRRFWFPG